MKVGHTATYAVFNAMRNATAGLQNDLVRLQQEAVTGRLADPGLVLGARTEQLVSFQSRTAEARGIIDANAIVESVYPG